MLKYKTIFENNDFIIINKPAGLLTHGSKHIKELTLVDQLLKDYPKIAKVGEDPSRPGIMHRLDRHVSGLLVIAKTQIAFDYFKNQFQKRTIEKIYIGLVYGKIEKDEDEINFPIQRSAKGYKMAALPFTEKGCITKRGKRAITQFKILKIFINYTLLEIKIKTGRAHQIRVHMAAYGHPLIGDDLYSTKKTREKNKKINLGRIFLTAVKLSFLDLDGKQQSFEIDLPNELKNLLKQIK